MFPWLELACARLQHWDLKRDCCNYLHDAIGATLFFLPYTLHASDDMAAVTWSHTYKRDVDVVLSQTWQNSVCYALTRSFVKDEKVEKYYFDMRDTSFLRSKCPQANAEYFLTFLFIRHLIVNYWEKSVFLLNLLCNFRPNICSSDIKNFLMYSFRGTCGIHQWVIKCSLKSSLELLNGIRMAWKLPLFTEAELVLSSRWPLREMFCLPHNIMVLIIALRKFIFLSNISWFYVEILKWQGFLWFWALWISATPVSSALWWHCIFWWRSSAPSLPTSFFSFLECLSLPLTTVLEKNSECEEGELKWF